MDLTSHYERVIRDLGDLALRALLLLNAFGAFIAWLSVLSASDALMRVAAGYFLAGLIAAFAAILVTYVLAQFALARGGLPVGGVLALWAMILPPALALLMFSLGFSTAISAFEGGV